MSAGRPIIHTTTKGQKITLTDPDVRKCRQCCNETDEFVLCHVCNGPVCNDCAKTIMVGTTPHDVHEKWCYKGQDD